MGTTGTFHRMTLGLLFLSIAAVNLAGTASLSTTPAEDLINEAATEEISPFESPDGLEDMLEATATDPNTDGTKVPSTAAQTTEKPTSKTPSSEPTTSKQPTTAPTTKAPTTNAPTPATTKQPTQEPTTKLPSTQPAKTTAAGGKTAAQVGTTTAATTSAAAGSFDAVSFVGGIVLGVAIVIIVGFAYSFYKNRRDKNYHTL